MRKFTFLFLSIVSTASFAQFVEVPINHARPAKVEKKKSGSARTQAIKPLNIPFWDDFSFVQDAEHAVPNDTLYQTSKSIWVNNGVGIKPPSIYSATFDGIDSTGKPYNLTDLLAKGFADRLISRPIDLSGLSPQQDDSVQFSFFYQPTGSREAPDTDDNLSVWFKDEQGIWEKVFEVGNSNTLDPTVFYYQVISVDKKFFYNNFQFKIQNFARLSGPYDAWNVDYIYLNKRRFGNTINSHDQAPTRPITSIFKQYNAIPIKHLKDTIDDMLSKPTAASINLYTNINKDQGKRGYKYVSSVKMWERINGITSTKVFEIDTAGDIGNVPIALEQYEYTLTKGFPGDSLDFNSDSTVIDFKFAIKSKDDGVDSMWYFYRPLDFTINDSIHSYFTLKDFYAYDDGTAEYGAGLNQNGTRMAYLFDMFTKEPDTVVAVNIHFPEFGDNTSQTLTLKLWRANANGTPGFELHSETINVIRHTSNTFEQYTLVKPIGVQGKFFIGWEQKVNVSIPVGLDKNSDSGDKIYMNITGDWTQNQNVRGSLMIRPVFGKGDGSVVSGLSETTSKIFPNPNNGTFNISNNAKQINVFDIMGRVLDFDLSNQNDLQQIRLLNVSNSMIIVRWFESGKIRSSRVMIKP